MILTRMSIRGFCRNPRGIFIKLRTNSWASFGGGFFGGVFWAVFLGFEKNRTRELNTNLFLKLFGHPRDIPANWRDIPPKSLVSLGFEGHTELFGPHPFTWKTPHPTRKYPDQEKEREKQKERAREREREREREHSSLPSSTPWCWFRRRGGKS